MPQSTSTLPNTTPRGSAAGGRFVAMLFCQLGSVNSLRDIADGLAASESELHH